MKWKKEIKIIKISQKVEQCLIEKEGVWQHLPFQSILFPTGEE